MPQIGPLLIVTLVPAAHGTADCAAFADFVLVLADATALVTTASAITAPTHASNRKVALVTLIIFLSPFSVLTAVCGWTRCQPIGQAAIHAAPLED
jgi:hypothetical protein